MEKISFLALFATGLVYGTTACTISCGPVVGPLLIAAGKDMQSSIRLVLLFGAGRIFSYGTIAALSYLTSGAIKSLLKPEVSSLIGGGAMIAISIYLAYKTVSRKGCSLACGIGKSYANMSSFSIGALFSLNLCAPLLALAAIAASAHSLWEAIGYGTVFGLGTSIMTTLFFGLFFAPVIKGIVSQFEKYRLHIEIGACTLLFIGGVALIGGFYAL